MTKQYQIQQYINRNVFKSIDELGNKVWMCIDLRYGDTFNFETRQEAINTFVSIWDLLNKNQKNLA
jgi:hypothetical protein